MSRAVKDWVLRHPAAERTARRLASLCPYSLRLGRGFWNWYAFYLETEGWSAAQLADYQAGRLRWLLRRLRDTSPFYAGRLDGVPIDEIRTAADLAARVPVLRRAEFAACYDRLRSREPARGAEAASTSGTTGSPMQFVHPAGSRAREWAAICHQWKRVGYEPARSRRAEFRGLTAGGRLTQDYPDQHMTRFSILHLHAANLPRIADTIRARDLRFYHGYPSALYLLAREILRSGRAFPEPEAVLLASEMVCDFHLDALREVFPSARLFAHYGCAEQTVLAAWCERRQVYHCLPQYSLVEIAPGTREIIGTNLHNDVNGFVRYGMTDRAAGIETEVCPDCRRAYLPILTGIEGRTEDFLYSRERGWIPPAVVTYPLKHLRAIREVQFVQEDPDVILVRYSTGPGADEAAAEAERREIAEGMARLAGAGTRLDWQQVDEMPRGPTGKFKWIVSRLDPRRDEPGGRAP